MVVVLDFNVDGDFFPSSFAFCEMSFYCGYAYVCPIDGSDTLLLRCRGSATWCGSMFRHDFSRSADVVVVLFIAL